MPTVFVHRIAARWLFLLLLLATAAPVRAQPRPLDAGTARDGAADEDGGADNPRAAPDASAPQVGPLPPAPSEPVPLLPPVIELPPVEADRSVAPVIDGAEPEHEPTPPVPTAERTGIVLKTLLGLLGLLVLAYVGGHPRVQRWEARLGVSQLITAGFPFILLGTVARHPSVGILSDDVLGEMAPLLRLGLGWIGFVVGYRFDARMLQALPASSPRVVLWSTLVPFVLVVAASFPLFADHARGSLAMRDPVFLRDAIILGLAGAMSAPTVTRLFASGSASKLVARIIGLEELAGVIGLCLVAAFFRPSADGATWQVPGATWVLLTIGLGTTIGFIVYAILQRRSGGPDFLVLTLGSISFAAGAAGYLYLSSVVVAFIAGALLANLSGTYHARLGALLRALERPIYLLSLVVIGALWKLDDLRAWWLMLVFMSARLTGKWLATQIAAVHRQPEFDAQARAALALSPIGSLAIAIVVNAQLLYPGGSIALIASAVVGGGVLTEVVLQVAARGLRPLPMYEAERDAGSKEEP